MGADQVIALDAESSVIPNEISALVNTLIAAAASRAALGSSHCAPTAKPPRGRAPADAAP